MAWSKAKTAIVAGVCILLAAGMATFTVKEIQAHRTYPWQVPNADFSVFYKMPPAVKIVPTKFAQSGGWCADGSRGAMGIAQPIDQIVRVAYQQNITRTIVNADLSKGRYDFFAKLVGAQEPHKNMTIDPNWTIALQKEIKRQFGVKGTLAMRDTDVLVLKPADGGTHGFKVSHTMPHGRAISQNKGNLSFFEQPIGTLTAIVERHFQVPIVDQSGLTEQYDFTLAWDEPDPKQPNPEGLKQALSDQLGLELVRTNMPIQMLVVEKDK